MKLKYRISDGEIIAIGYMPDLKAEAGESVEDFNGKIPYPLNHYKRISSGILEKKPNEDIVEIKRRNQIANTTKIQGSLTSKRDKIIILLAQKIGITTEEIEKL